MMALSDPAHWSTVGCDINESLLYGGGQHCVVGLLPAVIFDSPGAPTIQELAPGQAKHPPVVLGLLPDYLKIRVVVQLLRHRNVLGGRGGWLSSAG